ACQYLIGSPDKELSDACAGALRAFVEGGAAESTELALKVLGAAIKRAEGGARGVLPSITREKRVAVEAQLSLLASGPEAVERAIAVLPTVRQRIRELADAVSLPGIRHRFEMAASIAESLTRSEADRIKAAGAILYV